MIIGSLSALGLSYITVTLVPVLMGYLIRGRIPDERRNPLNRALIAIYRPLLDGVLAWPKATIAVALLLLASTAWPIWMVTGRMVTFSRSMISLGKSQAESATMPMRACAR